MDNEEITLAKFVRLPAGSKHTYMMRSKEISPFLKRLSTYSLRAKADISYKVATIVWDESDVVQRMVVLEVMRQGQSVKPRGRHKSKKSK